MGIISTFFFKMPGNGISLCNPLPNSCCSAWQESLNLSPMNFSKTTKSNIHDSAVAFAKAFSKSFHPRNMCLSEEANRAFLSLQNRLKDDNRITNSQHSASSLKCSRTFREVPEKPRPGIPKIDVFNKFSKTAEIKNQFKRTGKGRRKNVWQAWLFQCTKDTKTDIWQSAAKRVVECSTGAKRAMFHLWNEELIIPCAEQFIFDVYKELERNDLRVLNETSTGQDRAALTAMYRDARKRHMSCTYPGMTMGKILRLHISLHLWKKYHPQASKWLEESLGLLRLSRQAGNLESLLLLHNCLVLVDQILNGVETYTYHTSTGTRKFSLQQGSGGMQISHANLKETRTELNNELDRRIKWIRNRSCVVEKDCSVSSRETSSHIDGCTREDDDISQSTAVQECSRSYCPTELIERYRSQGKKCSSRDVASCIDSDTRPCRSDRLESRLHMHRKAEKIEHHLLNISSNVAGAILGKKRHDRKVIRKDICESLPKSDSPNHVRSFRSFVLSRCKFDQHQFDRKDIEVETLQIHANDQFAGREICNSMEEISELRTGEEVTRQEHDSTFRVSFSRLCGNKSGRQEFSVFNPAQGIDLKSASDQDNIEVPGNIEDFDNTCELKPRISLEAAKFFSSEIPGTQSVDRMGNEVSSGRERNIFLDGTCRHDVHNVISEFSQSEQLADKNEACIKSGGGNKWLLWLVERTNIQKFGTWRKAACFIVSACRRTSTTLANAGSAVVSLAQSFVHEVLSLLEKSDPRYISRTTSVKILCKAAHRDLRRRHLKEDGNGVNMLKIILLHVYMTLWCKGEEWGRHCLCNVLRALKVSVQAVSAAPETLIVLENCLFALEKYAQTLISDGIVTSALMAPQVRGKDKTASSMSPSITARRDTVNCELEEWIRWISPPSVQ